MTDKKNTNEIKIRTSQAHMQNQKLISFLSHRNAVKPDSLQIFEGASCDENSFDKTLCAVSFKITRKVINGKIGSAGNFYHISPLLGSGPHCLTTLPLLVKYVFA